jgi:DNA (cytosine-5)-methyltransferase 1
VPDWEKLFVDGEQVADVKSIPWRALTKSSQVRMCGNSVCPPMARALIEANFGHERELTGRAA